MLAIKLLVENGVCSMAQRAPQDMIQVQGDKANATRLPGHHPPSRM